LERSSCYSGKSGGDSASGIIVRFDLEVDDNFIYDNPNPIEGLIV
jgi:hypothetical protein